MIPIRDENPADRVPWATYVIIAVNVGVFAYQLSLSPAALEAFWFRWAVVPARFLADPLAPAEIATVFTSMFMHGGWLHIAFNMLYLWIFGNNVEDRFGHFGFAAFYVTCGIAACLAQMLATASATIPSLGASGAIAGVLGGYLVLFPGAVVVTIIPVFFFIEVARLPAYLVIIFWFVVQLASALVSLGHTASAGGVAWFAHIGGFVAGLLLAAPAALRHRRTRAMRPPTP